MNQFNETVCIFIQTYSPIKHNVFTLRLVPNENVEINWGIRSNENASRLGEFSQIYFRFTGTKFTTSKFLLGHAFVDSYDNLVIFTAYYVKQAVADSLDFNHIGIKVNILYLCSVCCEITVLPNRKFWSWFFKSTTQTAHCYTICFQFLLLTSTIHSIYSLYHWLCSVD